MSDNYYDRYEWNNRGNVEFRNYGNDNRDCSKVDTAFKPNVPTYAATHVEYQNTSFAGNNRVYEVSSGDYVGSAGSYLTGWRATMKEWVYLLIQGAAVIGVFYLIGLFIVYA
jgi:hypothetical protein